MRLTLSIALVTSMTLGLATSAAAEQSPPEELSPVTAAWLPLAVTAGSIGTLTAAAYFANRDFGPADIVAIASIATFLVGPSAGQLYAERWGPAIAGTSLRLAGTGFMLAALGDLVACEEDCDSSGTNTIAAIGLGLFAGGTIYSLLDAPLAIRRSHSKRRKLQASPALITGPGGSQSFGAQLNFSF